MDDSSTVVGALIITIMFAAAFTVPGVNNQDTGHPIFSNEPSFTIFIVSDAISLFAASTCVLTFLGGSSRGTFCGRWFGNCFLNKEVKHRFFHALNLHSNNDGILLCCSFPYASKRMVDTCSSNGICYRTSGSLYLYSVSNTC